MLNAALLALLLFFLFLCGREGLISFFFRFIAILPFSQARCDEFIAAPQIALALYTFPFQHGLKAALTFHYRKSIYRLVYFQRYIIRATPYMNLPEIRKKKTEFLQSLKDRAEKNDFISDMSDVFVEYKYSYNFQE